MADNLPDLHQTVLDDDYDKVLELLESGQIDIEDREDEDKTGLYLAAQSGYEDIVELFLKRGAEVDARSNIGYTPLHIGAETGNLDCVVLLLQYLADVNARESEWGSTPLIMASFWGYADVAKILLDNGADASISAYFDYSPLGCASVKGHYDVVKLLLAHGKGVDIETKASNGYTPLLHATGNAYINIIDILLSHGADISAVDSDGVGIAHILSSLANLELLRKFIKMQVNLKIIDNNGDSALHKAVEKGHLNVVKLLVQNGVNLNHQNKKGLSALHFAAEKGHADIARFLQTIGADANLKSSKGDTATDLAYFEDHLYVVEILKLVCKPSANATERKQEYKRLDSFERSVQQDSNRSKNAPVPKPRSRTNSTRSSNTSLSQTPLSLPQDENVSHGKEDSFDSLYEVALPDKSGSRRIRDEALSRSGSGSNPTMRKDSGYSEDMIPGKRPPPRPKPRTSYMKMEDDWSIDAQYVNVDSMTDKNSDVTAPPEKIKQAQDKEADVTVPKRYVRDRPKEDYDTKLETNTVYAGSGKQTAKKGNQKLALSDSTKSNYRNPFKAFFRRAKQSKEHTAHPVQQQHPKHVEMGQNIHKDLEGLQIAPNIKQMLTDVFIEFDKLLLGDMIGRGNFGRVYVGKLETSRGLEKVAVKTTKCELSCTSVRPIATMACILMCTVCSP